MNKLGTVAVYCGSSLGKDKVYTDFAVKLGETLATRNIHLVYGGGNIGLMGVIANMVLQEGGRVTGVLPHFLNKKEIGNLDIDELILVDSMHERKQKISNISDGFIAMPGGLGTLEELAEMMTWTQLGLSRKPIGLLNINGFYDLLLQHFDKMVKEGFMKENNRSMLVSDEDPEALLDKMLDFKPIKTPNWLQSDQT